MTLTRASNAIFYTYGRSRSACYILAFLSAVGLLGLGSPECAAYNATVNTDLADGITTVPDNGMALHTSVYSNRWFTGSTLPGFLTDAGVQMLRFPGGSYSDIYHWSIPPVAPYYTNCCGSLPDVDQPHTFTPLQGADPAVSDPWPFGYNPSQNQFVSFMDLLDATGTEAMVTVNYGSSLGNYDAGEGKWLSTKGGQPQEAAAWVAYANADPSIYGTVNDVVLGVDEEGIDWKTAGYWARLRASTLSEYQTWAANDSVYDPANEFLAVDRDNPVGVKHWEIGNEINGNGFYGGTGWEEDLHEPYDGSRSGDVDLAPQTYGANLIQFSQLMKEVDPTIQIGAVMVGNAPGAVGNTGASTNWDRRMLLAAGDAQVTVDGQDYNAMDFGILHWYVNNGSSDSTLLNATASQLPGIFQGLRNRVDSYTTTRDGSTFPIHMTEFGYFGSVSHSTVTGLFSADTYATAMEQGAETVHFLEMSSLFLSNSNSPGGGKGGGYRAFEMLDKFFDPGDELIEASSSSSNLKVHVVEQDDGTVALMLLNLLSGSSNDAQVTINIDGATLDENGTQWLYGVDQLFPLESAVGGLGNNFTYTVPDRSIVVLLIPALAAPALVGDYNDDGVVDAADYTVWRDAKENGDTTLLNRDLSKTGQPVDEDDYMFWRDNFGMVLGSGAGSAGSALVPEPSAWLLASLAFLGCAGLGRRRRR